LGATSNPLNEQPKAHESPGAQDSRFPLIKDSINLYGGEHGTWQTGLLKLITFLNLLSTHVMPHGLVTCGPLNQKPVLSIMSREARFSARVECFTMSRGSEKPSHIAVSNW